MCRHYFYRGFITTALCFLGHFFSFGQSSFEQEQLKFSRVRTAKSNTDAFWQQVAKKHQLNYPFEDVFIRIFKKEEQLEIWAKNKQQGTFQQIQTFPICYMSGTLGPKREQGDLQVPEGFYHINLFNPTSTYHLSLQINYPNSSDKILTTNPKSPGSLIFIHGNCVSLGCVSMTDPGIEKIYWLLVRAKKANSSPVQVHIFPFQMNERNMQAYKLLTPKTLMSFWENLEKGYAFFEKNKRLPKITTNAKGLYVFE